MIDKYKRRRIIELLKAREWRDKELAYKTDAELIDLLILELALVVGREGRDNEGP